MADKFAKQKIVAVRKMQKYFMTINFIGQRVGRSPNAHQRRWRHAFKQIWTDLTSARVMNSTKFRPFFSLNIFQGANLRVLMLVRPAAAVNNGNPGEEDFQQLRTYGAEFYTMNAARTGSNLLLVKSPHPTMKTYLEPDRQAWVDKLFGFDEFKSGLAAESTNAFPP